MISRLKDLLFINKSIRQTIVKNVFWLSFSNIISRLIRAIIIIYSARILGANEYGMFSYITGLAGFFTIFSDIGINQILTRETTKYPQKELNYFSTAFVIKLFLFSFTVILVIFVSPFISKIENITNFIYFIALILIFDGFREFSFAFLRAKEKMETEAVIMTITNIAITIFGFIALYISSTSLSLIASYTFATAIGALIAILVLKEKFKNVFNYFDKNLIKPIINASWPITLNSIFGTFMLNTDLIMLGWWRDANEIGYYSASQRIIQVLYSLPAILASAIFPTISRLIGQNDKEKIKLLMEKSISMIFLIAIPLTIGGIILGKSIIEFIYGKEYLPATLVFQILVITLLIIFPGTLIGNSALAYNKQKQLAFYNGFSSLFNIIFNAILIPIYGITGAATSTIISQFINNTLSWKMLKKINNFSTLIYLERIIIGTIIMGIFSFFLNKFEINVIINIIFSALIYFLTLSLLKEKALEEIKIILMAIRKKSN